MSVFIYQEDAFDKMCIVEGEGLREFRDHPAPVFFGNALKNWTEAVARNPELLGADLADMCCWERQGEEGSLDGIIYGLSGWHRYVVQNSGEIIFLEFFCRISHKDWQEHLERARSAGFVIRHSWFPE